MTNRWSCRVLASAVVVLWASLWTVAADGQHVRVDTLQADAAADHERRALLKKARWAKRDTMSGAEPGWWNETLAWAGTLPLEERGSFSVFGLRPRLGGLPPGAGLTAGVTVAPFPGGEPWLLTAGAAVSWRRYWGAEMEAGWQNGRIGARTFARYLHMPQEDFYGLGPELTLDDGADYRLDEAIMGGGLTFRPHESLLLFGQAAWMRERIGAGTDDGRPNLGGDDLAGTFADVPGQNADVDYLVTGGAAALDRRGLSGEQVAFARSFALDGRRLRSLSLGPEAGYFVGASYTRYQDLRSDGSFGFHLVEAEAEQFVPIRSRYQVLAFREYAAFTWAPGAEEVPFYMMPALGGERSIRGYDALALRAENALLVNAEYRWQIFTRLDMALFIDAGYTYRNDEQLREISWSKLAKGYGVGFRYRVGERVRGSLDIGFSERGVRFYLRTGSLL